MFLGFLVDLFNCRRFGVDCMMEFPSTPSIEEAPTKTVKVGPSSLPVTFEIIRSPWALEQECNDGFDGFDDPRLPELII
ncbi:uncharacterized protein LOC119557839 [Drosophila subpulchrella]|uniref:uncharacterized protein LOC119557839 n=1 Tax=Drosophila subpulchrella TaxID=1486046 RepID=UPI0018A1A49F|nr:uncharacterized protein LOC119557839 [Drosophila subpulchrella]